MDCPAYHSMTSCSTLIHLRAYHDNLQAAVGSVEVGADITMAVPNMLEILPRGINKWVGMQLLLEDLKVG